MAITKKSLISNSPASKSKSKSQVKGASPAAAAKLATASRNVLAKPIPMTTAMRTTMKTTLRASRATYAKLTTARIVS